MEFDENEEGRGAERRAEQRQMHPPQGFADRGAKRPRRGIGIARDLAEAGLDRTQGHCEEADGVGEHHGKGAAREQETSRHAEQRSHHGVNAVVEPGKRDQKPDGENGAGNGVADGRDDAQSVDRFDLVCRRA